MESSLSRKRKANEIDDEYDMDKGNVLARIMVIEKAQKPVEASQSELLVMESEFEALKQRITGLEAENAELKVIKQRNTELEVWRQRVTLHEERLPS
ncbi:unnamed protein product [Rhizophagus irregularis]|nr:unnamed protein product [Rhizophagus irregularis]